MKIGIAIIDYGDKKWITDCLNSLNEKQSYNIKYKTFVYDCNKNNIGFSSANNELIKQILSSDKKYDWIWLLNNDTIVSESTLEKLDKILTEQQNDVGILGFQIRSIENPDLIHHGGTFDCYPAGVHKSGSVKLKQLMEVTYEKWVTFASVLIKREVFETTGLLDWKMFNYYSDSDFCFRTRYCGWKIKYIPELIVYHKIGSSQNPNKDQQIQIKKDSIVFENKWINGKTFFDLDKEVLNGIHNTTAI